MDFKVTVDRALIRLPTHRQVDTGVVSRRCQVIWNPVEEEDRDVTWRQVLNEAVEVTTDPGDADEKVKVANLVEEESVIQI